MIITVHRGTHQIGGCCTEIQTANARIFIDFGTELPDLDGTPKKETLFIPGLTDAPSRCDGVLFTHSHGDHIGNIHRIREDIPIYMGAASRKISMILNERLQLAHDLHPDEFPHGRERTLAALNRAETFSPGQPIPALLKKGIKVIPLRVDHSAFDSYMFFVEAEGIRVLHTGDFRNHGYIGRVLLPVLEKYVGQVDWLVTEGTMLSRKGETVSTEEELAKQAREIMRENRNVFVLCSSTNIDRIRTIITAMPEGRPSVCDQYQKDVLDAVEQSWGTDRFGYQFAQVIPDHDWNEKLHNWMGNKGFVMFVRSTLKFKEIMEPYRGNCKVIYSMWSGYREQDNIKDFLKGFDVVPLHTSGHATPEALRLVYDTVKPRIGVIPIHTERPEEYGEVFGGATIVPLADGESRDLAKL